MYSMDKTPYGFSIVLAGSLSKEDLDAWLSEVLMLIPSSPIGVKLLIDATELKLIPRGSKRGYEEILRYFIDNGLQRSCVLYSTASVRLQLANISSTIGFTGERYLNTSKVASYKRLSREWLVFGKEPNL